MPPAELYTASTRCYDGLPELTYPFHDRDVVITACGRLCLHRKRGKISVVQDRSSASRKSTKAYSSPASCIMISDISTWSRRPCNHSTTRSARGRHPCLGYVPLPISPGRTMDLLAERVSALTRLKDFQIQLVGSSLVDASPLSTPNQMPNYSGQGRMSQMRIAAIVRHGRSLVRYASRP